MSDDLVYESALEEWMGILARLWTAFDKPLDPERLQIYSQALADVPLGLLEKAVFRVIRNHRFSNVPTVGDVWAAVKAELGNPLDVKQAIEEWCDLQWRKCVVAFPGPAEHPELSA
jgi:hypothetical protein